MYMYTQTCSEAFHKGHAHVRSQVPSCIIKQLPQLMQVTNCAMLSK